MEFKRFAFHNSKDPRAAAAHRQVADLYFGYFKDVNSGKAALANIIKGYPKSPEAADAQTTLNLFAKFRGSDTAPLLEYLEGMRLARSGDAKGAAAKLVAFAGKTGDQVLASGALLEAGKLQLIKLNKPADALPLFQRIIQSYPSSPYRDEALFLTGQAFEKIKGGAAQAMQAYTLAAAKKNTFQQPAKAALQRLQKQQNLPARQFDAKQAGSYKNVRNDYGSDTLIATIEVAQGIAPAALQATMEKALFDHIEKRRDSKHHIVVNAYYSYPITEAGGVNWKVGSKPTFTVKKMKAEDAVKTLIFDLFKKR